jgi:hypothetical protein
MIVTAQTSRVAIWNGIVTPLALLVMLAALFLDPRYASSEVFILFLVGYVTLAGMAYLAEYFFSPKPLFSLDSITLRPDYHGTESFLVVKRRKTINSRNSREPPEVIIPLESLVGIVVEQTWFSRRLGRFSFGDIKFLFQVPILGIDFGSTVGPAQAEYTYEITVLGIGQPYAFARKIRSHWYLRTEKKIPITFSDGRQLPST